MTGLLPVAAALLNEPQAHDVFERPEAALDRALVGEVRVANCIGQNRLVRLHAEQRPCTAGAERKAARAGDGGHGRGRVVRADSGEICLINAEFCGQFRTEFSTQRARTVKLRKDFPRQAQRVDRLPIPVLRGGVIEHGGRCVGVFRLCFARQEEAQQVGQHQQCLRCVQCGVVLPLAAVKLIDGVEIHGCDARAGKERREIDRLPDLRHILVDRIAVRARIGQQLAVLVKQAIVHAPGVDSHAYWDLPNLFTLLYSIFNVFEQPFIIPAKAAVLFGHSIFKPIDLFQYDLSILYAS